MRQLNTETELIIEPDQPATNSVIWLHGLGADGYDFVSLMNAISIPEHLSIKFIFPHAPYRPVTINQGYKMRAWYDIACPDLNQQVDWPSIHHSMAATMQFIDQEIKRGIPPHRILLAGFSQGAVIALLTGLHYQSPLAGVLGLSGYLPEAEQTLATISHRPTTPIWLGHGRFDTIVPYALGLSSAHILKQYRYPVTWYDYPMEHSICLEEIADIQQWLIERLSI